MKVAFPEGGDTHRLRIRRLGPDDITERYLSWFRDVEVVRFLEARNLVRADSVAFLQHGDETGLYRVYAICLKETGEHIGNLKIGEVNIRHRVSDLVTVIGARAHWGKGFATEAIEYGTRVAFETLDMRKLSIGIYAGNIGSVKAYLRAGFAIEGVRHGQFVVDDRIEDELCLACFNPKYFGSLPSLPKRPPEID